MKKLLTFIIVSIVVNTTFAQDSPTMDRFRFGLKFAPTVAWLKPTSENLTSGGSGIGFNYGLMVDYALNQRYFFSSGIEISHKGGELKYTDNQSDKKFRPSVELPYTNIKIDSAAQKVVNYSVQYIEIPLTLKMRTNEIGYITYYAQVGVSPSINIQANGNKVTYTDVDGKEKYSKLDADLGKGINTFGLAMILGIGLEYSLSGDVRLMTGLTFNNCFTDVLSHNEKEYNNYNEVARANFLALNIGVFF